MAKGEFLGDFEQLVILAVLRLGDQAYAVSIHDEIVSCTGRNVSVGAVYATLDRLEQKGLVSSYLGDPTSERGGRPKRFIQITSRGKSSLRESQSALNGMLKGLGAQWQLN
jgi:PadR family transcriptional regulator PadR